MDTAQLTADLAARLPAALELLRRMVGINSWTDNPEGVNRLGELTAEAFAPLGFTAEFVPHARPGWGRHLVLTRTGSGGPTLALVSHLDTVFPPEEEERNQFRWQPEGDRIYGPGTHDIKGGTVMMWLVLAALRDLAPADFDRATWKLLLNASEETLSEHFGDVCRARLGPETRAILVFEAEGRAPGGRALVRSRKGRGTWRATALGRGAHAGVKHPHGANALVQLAHTCQEIARLTDYDRSLTFNVATVRGGTGLNRVPHEAVAEGEFRAFTPEAYQAGKARLLALAGPGQVASPHDGFRCQVRMELLAESRPWPRNPGTDALLALWQEIGAALGQTVVPEDRGGLSDGNLLWDLAPTVDGLGPGGDHDHCSERSADGSKLPEYVDVATFVPKATLNFLALRRLIQQPLPLPPPICAGSPD